MLGVVYRLCARFKYQLLIELVMNFDFDSRISEFARPVYLAP